ncbi:hypothetical protein GOV04_00220 [Candidatus Woesearchaeota archaeon]|nr:hypothetical protein [Candidatus Woesearchaeota archaeon]
MAAKKKKQPKTCCDKNTNMCSGGGGMYFLGIIGAAIYYISNATSFWSGALGLLKALVWPAFLVFEALKFIGA